MRRGIQVQHLPWGRSEWFIPRAPAFGHPCMIYKAPLSYPMQRRQARLGLSPTSLGCQVESCGGMASCRDPAVMMSSRPAISVILEALAESTQAQQWTFRSWVPAFDSGLAHTIPQKTAHSPPSLAPGTGPPQRSYPLICSSTDSRVIVGCSLVSLKKHELGAIVANQPRVFCLFLCLFLLN